MFDAYVKSSVATKLPLLVESSAANGKTLLVVTAPRQQQNAFLLKYSPAESGGSSSAPYDLQTCRNFAKKTVTQLRLISELDILVCLSDSIITVHDASPTQVNFQPICTLAKTKGASIFAVELVKNDMADNSKPQNNGYSVLTSPLLAYLCVAVRRKVHLYCWKNREFQEMNSLADISFSDNVRAMVWCNSHVAVAVRDEYFMVTIFSDNKDDPPGNVRPVCTVGTRSPLIVALPDDDVVGLCRDDVTVLATCDGNFATRLGLSEVRWSDCPQAIEYDRPYLLAMLKDTVEIRSLRPNQLIQTVQFPALKFLCRGGQRNLFAICQPAANQTDLYHLHSDANRVRANIQTLISQQQYELAVHLAESQYMDECASGDSMAEEKLKRVNDIKRLYAFHLFTQRRFNEAFELYKSVNTEVIHVIGLFPDFIPPDTRAEMANQYPGPLLSSASDLPRNDWLAAVQALTAYLSEIRTNIAKDLYLQNQAKDQLQQHRHRLHNSHSTASIASNAVDVQLKPKEDLVRMKQLLQIVDTTLLKCYLQTNDMLVASLLRLPDNSCDVAESEAVLIRHRKFSELLLLYEKRYMHDEALKLLKAEAKRADSPLKGIDRTIHYLQNLGNEHLGLILEYAKWVLKENSEDGLKIFTEDCDEVKDLNRQAVLEYLARTAPNCVIPYLEHIILHWEETNTRFHDALVHQYVCKVKELMADYVRGLPDHYSVAPAGCEPQELGRYRTALLAFLENSAYYTPELILVQLPHDSMFEERALILGRLKRHEQAIAIYTNILHDGKRAERYCRANYRRSSSSDSQVYLILLRMYARPPDNSIVGPMHANLPKPQPNIPQALIVLKDYAAYIDTSQALELLCPKTQLKGVWSALESVLQSTAVQLRDLDIRKSLSYSHYLRMQQQRLKAESVKWEIDYGSSCTKCSKKIGCSAFARLPDGSLVHYYCYKGAGASSTGI